MLDGAQKSTFFAVDLTARAVPVGFWEGEPKLSLVLGLRPQNNGADLSALPSALFDTLSSTDLSLEIIPIVAGTGIPVPKDGQVLSLSIGTKHLLDWTTRPDNVSRESLDDLWAHVMPEKEGDDFAELYEGLKQYVAATSKAPADDPLMPSSSLPDFAGQIAVACQIERAMVERMAIIGADGWQKRVTEAAARVALKFYKENKDALKQALPRLGSENLPGSSMQVSIDREKAAATISGPEAARVSQASQNLGATMCGEGSVSECRDRLREGPADKNRVAAMMEVTFEQILERLFYLNQANIRASSMGDLEAAVIKNAAESGEDDKKSVDYDQMPQPEGIEQNTELRLFQSRFKELETNGEFARMFGLVQDFALHPDTVEAIKATPVLCDPIGKPAHYMMIRFKAKSDKARALLRDDCSNFTLAKLSEATNDRPASFTPITRREVIVVLGANGACDARDCEVIPELDGVRLLSTTADGNHPSYELTSINPRDAMQDLDTRLTSILSLVAELEEDGEVTFAEVAEQFRKNRPLSEPWPLAALKSRSLRLYHAHQQDRVESELGRTGELHGKNCDAFCLDSDDLAIGWAYDASARCFGDSSNQEWHALSAARIAYKDARRGSQLNLEAIINARFRGNERARYQRASWAGAQQVKSAKKPDSSESDTYTVADELVFEYGGEQQGADNAVGQKSRSGAAFVKPLPRDGLLDIDREYESLEGAEDETQKPIELLNGIGYYLGARSVYIGGNMMPDISTRQVFEAVSCAPVPRLTTSAVRPGHRLLRSEKIAKPLVLLNGDVSSNKRGTYSRNYLPNTTRDVTLRSRLTENGYQREGRFDEERLMVVPGTVDLELAHRHGVLEGLPDIDLSGARLPRDGLRGIRMDNDPAGWATLDDVFSGEGASVVLKRREINAAVKPQGQPGGRAPSNAVYLPRNGTRRDQPYYPDPLHGWTAFRLRRTGTFDNWLGKTICVEQPSGSYPDAKPVSVTIHRADALRMALGDGDVTVAGTLSTDLQIDLPPGLSAELVVWPVPDLATFALSSEVVTLQTMITQTAKAGLACIDGLEEGDAQQDPIADCLKAAGLVAPEPGTDTCGIACAPAPGVKELKRVATELQKIMMQRPLDVVCGHSVVTLTHAVDKPKYVPVAVPPIKLPMKHAEEANPNIFARRSSSASEKPSEAPGLLANVGEIDDEFFGKEGRPGLSIKERGGTDIDLAGFLEIDPLTTGAIEIDVIAVNPLRGPIDDVLRTRGAKNVVDSSYPDLKSEETYGIFIYPDELTGGQQQKVRLARISDIPPFVGDMSDRDLSEDPWTPPKAYIALHRMFSLATNSDDEDIVDQRGSGTPVVRSKDGIAIDVDPVLNFTQSRRLGLRFRAIGRYARAMTRRRTGVELPEVMDVSRELVDEKATVDLPVPSSRRPDPPVQAVKAEITSEPNVRLPSSDEAPTWCRVNEVRLSFARPFLSSGPEERIGIVLSPRPSSFAKDGKYRREFTGDSPSKDLYRLKDRFPDPKNLPADLVDSLTQFADKGTRPPFRPHPDWHEKKNGPYGLFPVPLPLLADGKFDRFGKWCGSSRDDVGYISDAQLPIYEASYDTPAELLRPDIFFPVDLLTYLPRFDPETEHWYCNVRLDPRKTLDPHFQLGVVRYQPLAPKDLRVSPIGKPFLCPVLPRRVTALQRKRMGDIIELFVTTSGPAATDEKDGLDHGPKSRFVARLTGLERHGAAITHRHLDDVVEMVEDKAHDSRTARFSLPRELVEHLDIRLTVQEFEANTAATQPNEPVLDPASETKQEGGAMYRLFENVSAYLRST